MGKWDDKTIHMQEPKFYNLLKVMERHDKTADASARAVQRLKADQSALPPLLAKCADYWRYDEELAGETVAKYVTTLNRLFRDLPHVLSPADLRLDDITELKKTMKQRGVGPSGINSAVFALRKFLTYCRDVQKLKVLDPKEIQKARELRREVVYLDRQELISFFRTMNVKTKRGLRMRTLVHVLLTTGMRISEALSLNRDDIDWERKEAVIIGKGSKQRTVYFTDECLRWLKVYLSMRADGNHALFVTFGSRPKRLQRYDLSKSFRHYARLAGINKRLTPNILRHTFGTILMENGAPLPHIQKLLGHSDIKTTAKYYLGADKEAVKKSHERYLR
ncbi:MAG: hypothetical protein A3I31_00560 [Candidatus Colwellbacteria bacterium RIFCSPLOWO2_02_FULL_44_20b]|uniref:Tyr recombinase domain-containing protein n=1 Tax=Candidatus Colwellbacteria bacterium RIFCSPLOWO2_02_FULL_44_20b TaxID=1797691 RepID=A0A1G1Z6Z0_9BACT|nr:MAG: hypothetical protein A3I31_00560 [Candidatus Colwellbacteria bacterium RIFCSPLOWO2_02_FULL_44_20b]